ncbi:MAG: HlyD family secretion protein [Saprospiraceae bacterium]|jgi:HlyD family secretion protein
MDRPISSEKQQTQNRKSYLRYAIYAGVVVVAILGMRQLLKTNIEKGSFLTAIVTRGDIENTITAGGSVVAAFEEQLNSPISTQIQTVYLRPGAEVKKGDKIIELDQSIIKLQYGSVNDKLELRRNNITKLKLEFDKNITDLDYDSQIQGLQISGMEAALQDAKRLEKIGGATTEDVERAQLQLEIARLEKRKLENELEYRKSVVASDRRNLELELQIDEKELSQLRQKLNKTTVSAPRAGVITWVNEAIGQQVNEGDPLVRIANLDRFRIEARCSDRYSEQLSVGMAVRVRAGNSKLTGSISAISPAVENNTVEFIIELDEPDAEVLKPSMRVEVYIITDKKEDVLLVKNGAAFRGAEEQYIFQVQGESAIRKSIRVGLSNRDFVEIKSKDFKEGDRLIISDTKDLEHVEKVGL